VPRLREHKYKVAHRIQFVCVDFTLLPLPQADAMFIAPVRRRASGQRIFSIRQYIPPLTILPALLSQTANLCVKISPGVQYDVGFDPTLFVTESIKEVTVTLAFAIALVVLVIFLFLQNWRMTLIPLITIPISLVGTFALMKALGFSINTLTLFGLTLATGLVVDDAIVVIENIARFIYEKKMPPLHSPLSPMEWTRSFSRDLSKPAGRSTAKQRIAQLR